MEFQSSSFLDSLFILTFVALWKKKRIEFHWRLIEASTFAPREIILIQLLLLRFATIHFHLIHA